MFHQTLLYSKSDESIHLAEYTPLPKKCKPERRIAMPYVIAFFEGIITFISPCLLPMLPIYFMYFAGSSSETQRKSNVLTNALGFVLGFTLVFVTLGAFAGSIGQFLRSHQIAVNWVSGSLIILFGLNFLGVLPWQFFRGNLKRQNVSNLTFWSSILFGMVFSIGWTPCVGAFLGSALLMASQQGSVLKGVLMLLTYSLGLGIPFIISAVLLDQMKTAFQWIKQHYELINKISGFFLILVGLLMITGWLGRILTLLS
jgi:cytochrome c-type biogenesis protein